MQVIVLFKQHKISNRISGLVLADRNLVVTQNLTQKSKSSFFTETQFSSFPLTRFDGRQITRAYTWTCFVGLEKFCVFISYFQ